MIEVLRMLCPGQDLFYFWAVKHPTLDTWSPKFLKRDMKRIPLTQGKFALIDDEDFERVSQYKWHASKSRYCWYARKGRTIVIKTKSKLMHNLIITTPKGMQIDHINRNGLDNRRKNLRIVTPSENRMNLVSHCGSSKYKGVSWHTIDKRWRAYITKNRKRYWLRTHKTQEEAARTYDKAAKELFGKYAYLNFREE